MRKIIRGLALVVVPGGRRSWLGAAKGGIAAVAGLLLAPGLVMLFFAARGAFDPFLYGVLWHNLVPGLDTGRLTAAGTLSPVQAGGADSVVKSAAYDASTSTLTVPARTVAVFVQPN